MWRDRLQSDREHRCCTLAVVANDPCLSQGARSRQPRWSCSLDTAAVISIPDGLECRIVGAQRLEPKPGMSLWWEKLFAWMVRSSATPMDFFLPTRQPGRGAGRTG